MPSCLGERRAAVARHVPLSGGQQTFLRRPGIDDVDPGRLEIDDVAHQHGRAVDKRHRSDGGVTIRARVGNVKLSAAKRYRGVDGQCPLGELGQDVAIHPGTKPPPLCRGPPLAEPNAELQFHECDARDVERRRILQPVREIEAREAEKP